MWEDVNSTEGKNDTACFGDWWYKYDNIFSLQMRN